MNGPAESSSTKSTLHQNGFSIVAVLVASALMGLLAIAFSEMIINSKKGQKSVEGSIDFDILKSSIAMVINNPTLCATAFKTNETPSMPAYFINPPSSIPTNKRIDSLELGGSTIAKVGMKFGSGLTIDKLELQHISTVGTSYLVGLLVEVTRPAGNLGTARISNANNLFKFIVSTNPSNEINSCAPNVPTPPPPPPLSCRVVYQGNTSCTGSSTAKSCYSNSVCNSNEEAVSGGGSCVNGIMTSLIPSSNGWGSGCWAQSSPTVSVGLPNSLQANSWVKCCIK